MTIFTLLGLPGSGKSYYGQQLAAEFRLPFLPENATRLIHQQGFVPGVHGSLQFDQEIFLANVQTINEVLALDHSVIWEGGPLQDQVFIKARINFSSDDVSQRQQLLTQYERPIFQRLHRHTHYILFDIAPKFSLHRQQTRQKPELLTAALDFLAFLRQQLLDYCKMVPQQSMVVDMHQSKHQIINQLFHRFHQLY